MQLSPSAIARMSEERDVIAAACNALQIATRTGNTELALPCDLIGDVMMMGIGPQSRPSFREWCMITMDNTIDGEDLIVPRDYVGDVLALPMFQTTRKLFRDYCDSNLAALPGIDDLTRDRLRRMIKTQA